MSSKFVVKKILLPRGIEEKVEKTEPTLENVVKSVLSYCNAFPVLCEINEVPEEYQNPNELVFYFDKDKYRFFDVVSPTLLFYGIKYGDESTVLYLYNSRILRSIVTLMKAEDLLKLMGIKVEYMKSFVEKKYEEMEGG